MTPQSDDSYISALRNAPLVSQNSITTYIANLKKAVTVTEANTIHALLRRPQKFIPILRSKVEKLNSRITMYISIITAMRTSGLKHEKRDEYNLWYATCATGKVESADTTSREGYAGMGAGRQDPRLLTQGFIRLPFTRNVHIRAAAPSGRLRTDACIHRPQLYSASRP